MIYTLISTATASGDSSVSITSGIDSTYDHYMFVITDYNPSGDGYDLKFQVNATNTADYNDLAITNTSFSGNKQEGSNVPGFGSGGGLGNSVSFMQVTQGVGSDSDESGNTIMHLFTPANSTYQKFFLMDTVGNASGDPKLERGNRAGYISSTTAIDDIQFKVSSGTFDAVIQMYGVA